MAEVRASLPTVPVGRESLAELLEYAYRGEAALGGNCRNDRDPDCTVCAMFTEAETAIGDYALAEHDWWKPTLRERLTRSRKHGQ